MSTQTQIEQVIANGGVPQPLAQSIAKKIFEEIFRPLIEEEPGKEAPPEKTPHEEPERVPATTEPQKQTTTPRPHVPHGGRIDDREATH